jgi:hypothetical protein
MLRGDILIHLGDLFDNRTSLPIIILNKVERILKIFLNRTNSYNGW